jgi:hypothetical protein
MPRVDPRRGWHGGALFAFALAAALSAGAWLGSGRMPPGDFPGYAAQVSYVRDALLANARVPIWCVECYGGTTNFTSHLKEVFAFPLAVAFGPVAATQLAFVLLRALGALGLYWLVARELAAPAAGIAAGFAYGYGAIANHQLEHLDVAVANAILPWLWIAAIDLWRHGGARPAMALGVAMACQLANNWVHAATAPLAVLALALVRPWDAANGTPAWRDPAWTRTWLRRGLAAFVVFLAFAASSLAWLTGDTRHHGLIPPRIVEGQRLVYVERSPFLFANRADALAPWLAEHQPPYPVPIADGGKRYLGAVLVAVIAIGAAATRRRPALRRYAALAALAFGLQYWLALGPRTLWWEIAESFQVGPAAQAHVATALRAAAALCALAAVGTRKPRGLVAAALLFVPTASLWSACARVLPMFAAQRSPGHFFDTAPFALSLLFAACLAALCERFARQRQRHALAALVTVALLIDYAPSLRSFREGEPLAPLQEAAQLVSDLPGEDGMLRIGLGLEYAPISSWILAQSHAGHAWGWLFWQAGRHWRDSYAFAAAGDAARGGTPAWSARYEPLLAAARVRFALLRANAPGPPAPWRRVRSAGRYALWERAQVPPVAQGYRAWILESGDDPAATAQRAADALRANAVLIAPPDDLAQTDVLRANAATALPATPAPAPIPVSYERSSPERISLALDAGNAPALAFVSEGHHAWWRARLDGQPAPVLRASIAHLGVLVPPGRHEIELQLVRPALVAGADALTTGAWLALAVGAPLAWTASRRRAGRADLPTRPSS